jgi:hypothetical protein
VTVVNNRNFKTEFSSKLKYFSTQTIEFNLGILFLNFNELKFFLYSSIRVDYYSNILNILFDKTMYDEAIAHLYLNFEQNI